MKENRFILGLELLTLLCVLSFTPVQVSGALVWSETFEELDPALWENYSCQIIDGILRGVQGDHISAVRAYYRSNVSVGTWKFDLVEVGGWGEELDVMKIYFMSPEKPDYSVSYALSLVQSSGPDGDSYSYTIEKWYDSFKTNLVNYISEPRPLLTGMLQHLAITRDSSGLMSVYLNSTLILQATDTDITTTSYFGFYTWDDWAFDNVSVYDTIEIGGGLPLITIGVIAAVPIAIVAIILIRRK